MVFTAFRTSSFTYAILKCVEGVPRVASLKELEKLKEVDIEDANITSLVNIEGVSIDISAPATQRMARYLEEIKNPYCFLCGKTPVKITFDADGIELGEKVRRFFLRSKC